MLSHHSFLCYWQQLPMHSIMESVRQPVLPTHGELPLRSTKMPMAIVQALPRQVQTRGVLPRRPIRMPMEIG